MDSTANRRLNVDRLRRKLRQLDNGAGAQATAPVPVPASDTLADLLGGEVIDGCHVVTKRYDADYRYGDVPLRALDECDGRTLATLSRDARLSDFDFRRTLFLDTETNGLAGGAGTYAFLVGVAYWEESHFCVRQLFMRHPSEEPALLAALSPLLERFDSFVTFNGKSFDLPVLETRYVLAREPRMLKSRLHLDLLHPARRLWKLRLESCSLATLEHRVLGTARSEADVPGYLIPHLYNSYLRDGDPSPLRRVFYHNHQDLLALAALAVHMTRVCSDPNTHAAPFGQDLFSLARLYEDNREWVRAEDCYRRALASPISPSLRRDCVRRLSFLLKRMERWEEAAELWRSMLGQGALYPYVELAKYHEHQRRDLAAAERAVLAAYSAAGEQRLTISSAHRDELQHRLKRIRRKLGCGRS